MASQALEIHRLCCCVVAACTLLVSGCNSQPEAAESSNLRMVSVLYNRYEIANGQSPLNEERFKQFIEQQGQKFLEHAKADGVDALFLSERDGKPFVVLYGKETREVDSDVVAYEREAVNGKRLVGYRLGYVEEVGEEQFRDLIPNAGR